MRVAHRNAPDDTSKVPDANDGLFRLGRQEERVVFMLGSHFGTELIICATREVALACSVQLG